MRKLIFAIVASLATIAVAGKIIYVVKSGDTLGEIAKKTGASEKSIAEANHLKSSHKLQLGQKLVIPSAKSKPAQKTVASTKSSGTYVIRNGDNDWSIAPKFGITPRQLRLMNPDIDWSKLQLGQKINVPASKANSIARTASTAVKTTTKVSSTAYHVRSGDNDWLIARKFDTTVKNLKALNPNTNFEKLKVGSYVRVPSTAVASVSKPKSISSRYAVISKDSVIVRRGASTTTEKVTVVQQSTPVMVLDRQNEWYKLKFPRGTVGWVRGDMLKEVKLERVTSSSAVAKATSPKAPATTTKRPSSSTRIASASKAPATTPKPRTTVASVNKPSTRTTVTWTDDGSGRDNRAVSEAMGMIGTRYSYGSANRGATDCSGMVLQAYRAAGVKLPRTSAEMSKVGKSVSRGDLKPGDLVFFKTRGSRISHVGIYKGDGKFVHASSGKGHVTVSNLNDGYYNRRYAGAKRVTSTSSKSSKSAPVAKKSEPKADAPKEETSPEPKTESKPVENTSTNGADPIVP